MTQASRSVERGDDLRPPPRERLLQAADELFYREGVHTVGIDRIIEHAGVAKASLYSTFGSKEALVCAFLRRRQAQTAAGIEDVLARNDSPRERILGLFEAQQELLAAPGFNGCPFANASAEAVPGEPIHETAGAFRTWLRELLCRLARDAGAAAPEQLAIQLQLLYDGAALSGRMDGRPDATGSARAAAESLLDAGAVSDPLPHGEPKP